MSVFTVSAPRDVRSKLYEINWTFVLLIALIGASAWPCSTRWRAGPGSPTPSAIWCAWRRLGADDRGGDVSAAFLDGDRLSRLSGRLDPCLIGVEVMG
jgi:hypothetical protein